MSVAEIQEKVVKKIRQTEDSEFLEIIDGILNENFKESTPLKFTPSEKRAIEHARAQIRNGQFLTEEEANRQAEKWLED